MTEKIPTTQPNATTGPGGRPKWAAPSQATSADQREAAERALPGLAGTHARRQFAPAPAAAGEIRADIGGEHQQNQPQHQLRAAREPLRS